MHNWLFAEFCARSPTVTIYRKVLDFSLMIQEYFVTKIMVTKILMSVKKFKKL